MTSIDIRENKIIFDAPGAVVSRARVLRSSKFDLAHIGREGNPATHGGEHSRAAPRAPSEWTRQNGYPTAYFVAKRGSPSVMSNQAALKSTKM